MCPSLLMQHHQHVKMESKYLLRHRIQWPAAASAELMMLKKEIEMRFEMRLLIAVSHKQVKYDPGYYRYCISPLSDMNTEGGGDPPANT